MWAIPLTAPGSKVGSVFRSTEAVACEAWSAKRVSVGRTICTWAELTPVMLSIWRSMSPWRPSWYIACCCAFVVPRLVFVKFARPGWEPGPTPAEASATCAAESCPLWTLTVVPPLPTLYATPAPARACVTRLVWVG
jgi:hypothetical protein